MQPVTSSAPRPGVSPGLARRIDRLARSVHAFHRFAHHPLCAAYADELFAIGRTTRVCRGCALGLAGLLLGIAAGLALSPAHALAWSSLLVAASLAWISRRVRLPKTCVRFVPAAGAAFAAMGGPVPAACAAAIVLVWFARYRRTGPDRTPCAPCPERGMAICSGLAPMIRRERAFQRLSGTWLAR